MGAMSILLVGIVIVVGGVLWLRLHAFLALTLAALAVAYLTPRQVVEHYELSSKSYAYTLAGDARSLRFTEKASAKMDTATRYDLLRLDEEGLTHAKVGKVALTDDGGAGLVGHFLETDGAATFAEGDLVVRSLDADAALAIGKKTIGERIADGFGKTCIGIGILIAMASIIGKTMLDSGAAERIVLRARHAMGDERAPFAFIGSGFVIGMPVFFDTLFYLMIPLGKALHVKTGKNYLLYILSIVMGGTMAHSLVPPTPGPLFAAEAMGVSLGAMMIGGIVVGLFTLIPGYFWARYINSKMEIPLRETADLSHEELEAMAQRDESTLPPLSLSLLPILIPVILIAGVTVMDTVLDAYGKSQTPIPQLITDLEPIGRTLGNKNIALSIAAVVGLMLVVMYKKASRADIAKSVQTALAGGGVIILITAAGGAFGHVLRQTNIAGAIEGMGFIQDVGLISVAFFVTMLIRCAQGSATVAMITAAGIVAPLATSMELPYHPLYIALAMGCGSKPISWMNDSGFWIISKMSGMTEAEALKTNTVMTALMGFMGLIICLIGSKILPLV
ncbi:MAG: GntP family permease [Planctomycetota bacterium]|jgi:GntP family gluconate:H+ symporter